MALKYNNKIDCEKVKILAEHTRQKLLRNKTIISEISEINTLTKQGTDQHFKNKEKFIHTFDSFTKLAQSPRHFLSHTLSSNSFNSSSQQCTAQNLPRNIWMTLMEQEALSPENCGTQEKNKESTRARNTVFKLLVGGILDRIFVSSNNTSLRSDPNYSDVNTTHVDTGIDVLELINTNTNDNLSFHLKSTQKNVATSRKVSVNDCNHSVTLSAVISTEDVEKMMQTETDSKDYSQTHVSEPKTVQHNENDKKLSQSTNTKCLHSLKKRYNLAMVNFNNNISSIQEKCDVKISESISCLPFRECKSQLVQSALCPNTLIMPINVSVLPWDNGNITILNKTVNVRQCTERLTPSLDDLGKQASNVPPPPPLPNQETNTTSYSNLQKYPVKVFTIKRNDKSIFKYMEDIKIEPESLQSFRNTFSLKKNNTIVDGSSPLANTNKKEPLKPEDILKQNIGIVLKKLEINTATIIQSINTIDVSQITNEAIIALNQAIPKEFKFNGFKGKANLNPKPTEKFVSDLMSIDQLKEKVHCMSFSIQFDDNATALSKIIKSYVEACNSIRTSRKFQAVINVILAFLMQWDSEYMSIIYGFDVQELSSLAEKASEDQSTNVLQTIIEYMYNQAAHQKSLEFYMDFSDMTIVRKTTTKEMTDCLSELEKNLKMYEIQYLQILNTNVKNKKELSLDSAKLFLETAKVSITSLKENLENAKLSFTNCRDQYCVTDLNISEIDFFASVSKFVSAFQSMYNQIHYNQALANKSNIENPRKF